MKFREAGLRFFYAHVLMSLFENEKNVDFSLRATSQISTYLALFFWILDVCTYISIELSHVISLSKVL